VSRTSWLAIRAPLASRRATFVKVASFLLPLASWALLCAVWIPDIEVTDQGDGPYKAGDRVERAKFDAANAQILATQKDATLKITDKSIETLRAAGVPDAVLKKLDGYKGSVEDKASLSFKNRDDLIKNVSDDFDKDEWQKYGTKILDSAEQEPIRIMQGDPSNPIWLPTPWKVAKAFYHAFVTPPVGTGFKITGESLENLQSHGVSHALTDKLAPLKNRFFGYADKQKYLAEVGKLISPDELDRHKSAILKYTYVHDKDALWLHENLAHSCWVIFLGFVFSAIVGVPLGVLCGTFDLFSKLFEPFVDFIRYMPAPAFGVLCVAILGLYDGPKVAIIWIGTFFQMVLVVANTTRQFDESLLEAAQTLGATKRSLLLKVILPGILPALYNDMRILIGWAWTYLIVAEVRGAYSGITLFLEQQSKYRHFENVYAGIIMIGIIGLATDQVLAQISRVLFPWMPRNRGPGAWGAFFSAFVYLQKLFGSRASVAAQAQPAAKAG
jgi:ABC-type nitrate/sulfonate/bicarbonate transport system permease component